MVPHSHLLITTFFAVIVYFSSDKILPVPVYFLLSLKFNRFYRRDASLNLFFSCDCTYPPYSKMVMLVLAPLMLSLYITSCCHFYYRSSHRLFFPMFQIESNTHPVGKAEELFMELLETIGNSISR